MDFSEIFENALRFPISDYKKLLIVGVLFIIINVPRILASFRLVNASLSMIWGIVSLLVLFLLVGFGVSVLKTSINVNNEIPDFDWIHNFVDGIKVIIIQFVYFIIPAIIVSIIGFAIGYNPISKILTPENIQKFSALNSTPTRSEVLSIVPQEVWGSLFTAIAVTLIIGAILFIIFSILNSVAVCRFAKYDSFKEAFNFGEIIEDMKKIGIIRLFIFLIVLSVISAIISLVISFIAIIPFIGIIIAVLIGSSYSFLFAFRSLGLLYSDV